MVFDPFYNHTHLDWTLMPHLAYIPDLAPYDFFLLGRLKRFLHGKALDLDEKLQFEVKHWFKKQVTELHQSTFVSWEKCADCNNGYIV